MEEKEEKYVISVPEAGRRLNCSRPTAYALAKKGVIPTLKLGRKLAVPVAAFERMLESVGSKS